MRGREILVGMGSLKISKKKAVVDILVDYINYTVCDS